MADAHNDNPDGAAESDPQDGPRPSADPPDSGETPAQDDAGAPGGADGQADEAPQGPPESSDAPSETEDAWQEDLAAEQEPSPDDHPEWYDEDGRYVGPGAEEEDAYDYGEYDESYDYEHGDDDDYAAEDHDHEQEYEDYDEEEEEEEDEGEKAGQKKMTLVEHLDELRTRIIYSLLGLVVGVALTLIFGSRIIEILSAPLKDVALAYATRTAATTQAIMDDIIITTDMVDPFMMYLKMSLYVGIMIASPWIFTQAWLFVAAGLYEHERRYVRWAVPFSVGLFVIGAVFFLKVISYPILTFFFYFSREFLGVAPKITLKNHLTFMTNMMLVFGLCFQTPVAVLLLAKMGLVTVKSLNRYRKYVIVVMFIIAAFCTSPSPIDQIALALPMWLLFELGVVLAYFLVEKKRRAEDEQDEAELER